MQGVNYLLARVGVIKPKEKKSYYSRLDKYFYELISSIKPTSNFYLNELAQRITVLSIIIFSPFSLIMLGLSNGFKSLYNRVQKNYGETGGAIFVVTAAIATPFVCIGLFTASWAALVYIADTRR